ncbi:hypothetical protein BZG29_19780 [Janthinobacterium sp. LM6]|nr:hypothetical protein BZG29_19780 [Janthinobacterium sp. LM6]
MADAGPDFAQMAVQVVAHLRALEQVYGRQQLPVRKIPTTGKVRCKFLGGVKQCMQVLVVAVFQASAFFMLAGAEMKDVRCQHQTKHDGSQEACEGKRGQPSKVGKTNHTRYEMHQELWRIRQVIGLVLGVAGHDARQSSLACFFNHWTPGRKKAM